MPPMILRADAYYPSHKYELRRRKIKIDFSKTKWKVKNFEPHSRHSAQLMPQMFTGRFSRNLQCQKEEVSIWRMVQTDLATRWCSSESVEEDGQGFWFLMTSPIQEFCCCSHFSWSNRCITIVSTEVTLRMLRTVEIDCSIFRHRGLGTMTMRNVQKIFLLYILLRSHTAPSENKFDNISCGSADRLKFYKKKDMNKLWNYSEMIVLEYEARCAFDPV